MDTQPEMNVKLSQLTKEQLEHTNANDVVGVPFRGDVLSIYISLTAGAPMESLEHVQAIAGRGLEGDRYFNGTGYWSKNTAVSRDITLIEIESIEALARDKRIHIGSEATRRNILTRGVPLNHLVGREFQVGSVRLRGTRLCEPCAYLESLTTKGLLAGLVHRGGLRADILRSGIICVGDPVTIYGAACGA